MNKQQKEDHRLSDLYLARADGEIIIRRSYCRNWIIKKGVLKPTDSILIGLDNE